MNPFFFDGREARLFGVYHSAIGMDRDHGVVIANPFGQEYIRCHRALRHLARILAESGFHVLRFDYSGTGDSRDLPSDSGLEAWRADIASAYGELQELSGASKMSLVGVRLGANLCLSMDPVGSGRFRGIVAWDPISDGADYLEMIEDLHKERCTSTWNYPRPEGKLELTDNEVLGHSLSDSFRESIAAFDMERDLVTGNADELRLVCTTPVPSGLMTALAKRFPKAEHRVVDAVCAWEDISELENALMVPQVIEAIHETLLAVA